MDELDSTHSGFASGCSDINRELPDRLGIDVIWNEQGATRHRSHCWLSRRRCRNQALGTALVRSDGVRKTLPDAIKVIESFRDFGVSLEKETLTVYVVYR